MEMYKKILCLFVVSLCSLVSNAAVVTQFSFEDGTLSDTASNGTTSDSLTLINNNMILFPDFEILYPDFEKGVTGWYSAYDPNIVQDGNEAHSGSYSCLTYNRTFPWSTARYFNVPLQNGRTYQFSAWGKLASGTDSARLWAVITMADGSDDFRAFGEGTLTSTEWNQISGEITVQEAGSSFSTVGVYMQTDTSTANLYTDDYELVDTTRSVGAVGHGIELYSKFPSLQPVLTASDSADLSLTGDWTIDLFIKMDEPISGWHKHLIRKGSKSDYEYFMSVYNNKLEFFADDVQVIHNANNTSPDLCDNRWHHLAISNDADDAVTGLTAWVDGNEVYSGAGLSLSDGDGSLFIGDDNDTGSNAVIQLDEIRFHDEALDSTAIQTQASKVTSARASTISPAPGATLVGLDEELDWNLPALSTASSYTVQYRARGSNYVPGEPNFSATGTTTEDNVTPPLNIETLAPDTTYYWQLTSYPDANIVSPVWSFTTAPWVYSPTPANSAIWVDVNSALSWTGGKESGVTYKVYLDTNTTPTTLVSTQTGTSYEPSTLDPNTIYYWRIDTVYNAIPHTGTVWQFTTRSKSQPDTYVVSPTGSDSNAGTEAFPFLTISKAAEEAMPGDTILVKAGDYRERVSPPRGGTEDHPITYKTEELGTVFIKGSELWDPTWTRVSGTTVYHAKPNDALFNDRTYIDSYNPFKVKLASNPGGASGEFTCGQVIVNGSLLTQKSKGSGMINSVAVTEMSWGYDESSEHIYINFGSLDPAEQDVEITTRRRIFAPHLKGLEYIIVDGFVFEHCGNQFPAASWADPINAQAGAVGFRGGHHWIVRNNVIRYANTLGLTVGNPKNTFSGDNELDPSNSLPYSGGGPHPYDNLIENNYIIDNGASGIVGLGSVGMVIRNNVVMRNNALHFPVNTYERAGIKLHQFYGGLIEENYIANNACDGVWCDNGWPESRITGNVIVNNNELGIFMECTYYDFDTFLIDNNILMGNAWEQLYSHDASGFTAMNNLIASNFGVDGGCTIRQMVSGRGRSSHNSLYNNLFVNHNYIGIGYPSDDGGPQRLNHNVYDSDGDFIIVYDFGHNFDADGMLDLVREKVDGLVSPPDPNFIDLSLSQWRTFWDTHGLKNELHSQQADMSAFYNDSTQRLTLTVPFEPNILRSTNHSWLDDDFFGDDVPQDGNAISGPFQTLQQGENTFNVWDGPAPLEAGDLPMLTNRGFELEIASSDWYGSGCNIVEDSNEVYSGNYSCRAYSRNDEWSSARQDVALENGKTYNFSVRGKLASGSDTGHLYARILVDSEWRYRYIGTGSLTSTGWNRISGQITFNEGAPITDACVFLKTDTSTADLYTDHYELTRVASLKNGSFEDGSVEGAIPLSWTEDFNCYGAYDGATSPPEGGLVLHPGSDSSPGGAYQDIPTVAGYCYEVSLYVQNFSGESGNGNVKVLVGNPGTDSYTSGLVTTTKYNTTGLVDNDFTTSANWTQVSFSFEALGSTTRLGIYSAKLAGQTANAVNVDLVSVTPINSRITNGSFEDGSTNGAVPSSWTGDLNCYGAYNGTANPPEGTWVLHPGADYAAGGAYQDIPTVDGRWYDVSLYVQNFAGESGNGNVKVLVGNPGTDSYASGPITTSNYSTTGLVEKDFTTDPNWTQVSFSFEALGSTTRLGIYNAPLATSDANAINVDDVSVTLTNMLNGSFEDGSTNGAVPSSWTGDLNCYGAYNGAANPPGGTWVLHPGNDFAAGGAYQDIQTIAGRWYEVSLYVQNFAGQSGNGNVKVLAGNPGTDEYESPTCSSITTSSYSTTGLVNKDFTTDPNWSQVSFHFLATGSTTRLGIYNAPLATSDANAVNVDLVSVIYTEGFGGYPF